MIMYLCLFDKFHLSKSVSELSFLTFLTHQVPVLPSYRNQSTDLHSKSIDWFLYEGNSGT